MVSDRHIGFPVDVYVTCNNWQTDTLLHELSHWTAAKKRLNRDLRSRFGTKAYAAEELVAELTAAFLALILTSKANCDTRATSRIGYRYCAIFTAASKPRRQSAEELLRDRGGSRVILAAGLSGGFPLQTLFAVFHERATPVLLSPGKPPLSYDGAGRPSSLNC